MEVRIITDDEVTAFREVLLNAFGIDVDADPGGDDRFRALIGKSQAWGAFDQGQLVATAGTFDHTIGLPGGTTLPIVGLTMVSVRPTHRRRGLLRKLLDLHFADARDRGYAASGLWASEAGIYGRFGYGIAAYNHVVQVERAGELTVAAGRELDDVQWIDEAQARLALPAIYERATAARPGALRRSEVWWRERRFLETPFMRGGASKRRHVLARRGDELVGYLVFRQRGGFTDGIASGKTEINELIAIDSRAEATLWRLALGMDLYPTVSWWNAPVDDSLPWLIGDSRRVKCQRADNLWLRIDDVAAALGARRYPADGRIRFEIDGASWELAVVDGRGRCAPTTHTPELRLDRASLGALFLGGTSATQLARAELVRGEPSAIAAADRLFASAIAPWCPEIF